MTAKRTIIIFIVMVIICSPLFYPIFQSTKEPVAQEMEENVLHSNSPNIVIYEPPKITEDYTLIIKLDDGSEFSISIKEVKALRKAVRLLIAVTIADQEADLISGQRGFLKGKISERHMRILEELIAELEELRDIIQQ